jgi:hypothetical protein
LLWETQNAKAVADNALVEQLSEAIALAAALRPLVPTGRPQLLSASTTRFPSRLEGFVLLPSPGDVVASGPEDPVARMKYLRSARRLAALLLVVAGRRRALHRIRGALRRQAVGLDRGLPRRPVLGPRRDGGSRRTRLRLQTLVLARLGPQKP